MQNTMSTTTLVSVVCAVLILHEVGASLIASSEIKYCTRTSKSFNPKVNGKACEKKFVVTLALSNSKVSQLGMGLLTTNQKYNIYMKVQPFICVLYTLFRAHSKCLLI